MTRDEFIKAVLAAPDTQARQVLYSDNPGLVNVETVQTLREEARQIERDDARLALQVGVIAQEMADRLDSAEARAYASWICANANHLLANYELAIQQYELADSLFKSLAKPLEAARTGLGAITTLIYLEQRERALQLAETCKQTFLACGDQRSMATLNLNLGILYARQGNHAQALECFQLAGATYQELGEALYAAMAQTNQAIELTYLDNFAEAEQLYVSARPIFAAADLRASVATADDNIAFLQYARGDYTQAFQTFERARTAFNALEAPIEFAYIDLHESDIYLDLNLPAAALRLAQQAEATFARAQMSFELACAHTNQAVALARMGQSEKALQLLQQARALFVAKNNSLWAAHTDLQRAEILGRAATYPQAQDLARAAMQTYTQQGLRTKQAYACIVLAQLHTTAQQWDSARSALTEAKHILIGVTAPWLIYRIEIEYGRIDEGQGDKLQAHQHYLQAITHIEQMAATLTADEQRTAFIADKIVPYESLVRLHLQEPAQAFSWAERAKSRALVDLLSAGIRPRWHATDETDRQRVDRLKTLREELNWLYTRLTRGVSPGETNHPTASPEVWAKIQEREQEVTALWQDLQSKHAEHFSLQQVTPLTAEEIQAGLPEHTALIEYFFARDQILAFSLTRQTITCQSLPGTVSHLTALLEELSLQLTKFQYGPAYYQRHQAALLASTQDILTQLYASLLQPFQAILDTTEALIIVPHGPLHTLPFQALRQPDGRYLVETHAVSYAPSAAVLKFCWNKPAPPANLTPLIVGIPDEHTPRIKTEALILQQILPEAVNLLDEAATFEAVCRQMPDCNIVHLAAHGLFRPEAPLLSGLRLADRWLAVQDIYNLELNASLVTLSACESGLGRVDSGDDMVGLVRGFLYAGASSLLVSLWMVDDASTTTLMTEFYRAFRRGLSKTQALRQAQLSILTVQAHPYYWAPMILVGNERY